MKFNKFILIIGILVIGIIALVSSQETIGGTWESVDENNVFPELISQEISIDGAETIIKLENPVRVSMERFKTNTKTIKGDVKSLDYFVAYNETYREPIYEEVEEEYNDTRINNETGENETYTETRTVQNLTGYENKTRQSWRKQEFLEEGTNKVKIVSKFEPRQENAIYWESFIKYPSELTGHTEDLNLTRARW